jgi:anti-sigma B factor antagonist/stage II sporulation protein AA (anti-sigma F factor antagonist)
VTDLDFELTAERDDGGGLRVAVRGELDIATAPRLEAALSDASAASVRVDLRGLTFTDSTGVRALLQATEDARAAGRDLRFRLPEDGEARIVFVETGIARLLPQDQDGA